MCGIAGIVGNNTTSLHREVQEMLDSFSHRGPDGQGMHKSMSGNCILGHRRLAILDLQISAAQPMSTADQRYTISYNGECYNYQDFKKELPPLSSTGDTAVVLHLLAKHKTKALPKLNGMFALSLWDEKEQTLLLARDRFGQKPLYYSEYQGRLYFASELRALTKTSLPCQLNEQAIDSYLRYGSVQGPQTIYKDVFLLSPSTYLIWTPTRGITTHRYWQPSLQKENLSSSEICHEFQQAVQRHTISDAPLGIFLSGGIDSSAILGTVSHALSGTSIQALTVSFPSITKSDEASYAHQMTSSLPNVNHEIIEFNANTLHHTLDSFSNALDQPTIDGLNTWIVSQAASQLGLKAVLSGLGSDELFGGYNTFQQTPMMYKLRKLLGKSSCPISKILRTIQTPSRKLGKLTDLLSHSPNPFYAYLVNRQLFSRPQINQLFKKKSSSNDIDHDYLDQLHSLGKDYQLPDQIALWELFGYMSQTLLRDADIMGMNHSVEIRNPFLDNIFSEKMISLPANSRIPQSLPKHRFVEAVHSYLPPKHITQKKRGFSIPIHKWLPHELHEFSHTGLQYLKQRNDLFTAQTIDVLWKKYQTTPQKIGAFRLWSLIILGHFLKKNRLI